MTFMERLSKMSFEQSDETLDYVSLYQRMDLSIICWAQEFSTNTSSYGGNEVIRFYGISANLAKSHNNGFRNEAYYQHHR